MTASLRASADGTQAIIGVGGVDRVTISGQGITPESLAQKLTRMAAVNATGLTSVDFTTIPSWATRVTVLLNGLSSNGTSIWLLRAGAGNVQTTGYSGSGQGSNGAAIAGSYSTAGIPMGGDNLNSYVLSGRVVLEHLGSNIWSIAGNGGGNDSGATRLWNCGGNVTLSGALDRIRLTTTNGTDQFDAGSVSVLYE